MSSQEGHGSLALATRGLLAADGALWAAFGILLATGTASIGDVSPATERAVAVLMLGNATALGLLAWQVLRSRKTVDYAAVALMVVNTVLSLADEVGYADLLVFALSLGTLVVLVSAMRRIGSVGNGRTL